MNSLKGQTALVTGGAVRIGRAICLRLAEAGANVVIHYHRSEQEAGELKQMVEQNGVSAWVLQGELGREDSYAALMDEAFALSGGCSILINNASVFDKETFQETSLESLNQQFNTNLFAPLLLMKEFALRVEKGSVVNLLDRRITSYDISCVPYVLSKKALYEAMKLAALSYAPGICVNGVAPGAILPPPGEGESYIKDKAGYAPLDRQCTPEEVAGAVLFCLTNESLTGQVIFVDGGQHLVG